MFLLYSFPSCWIIFMERVTRFKLFAIFVSDVALGHEHHSQKLQMLFPSTPNGTSEAPRSVQERPGRAPRESKNHPPRTLRGPLGVQKASWGGIGSLGAPLFWNPQGQYYLMFLIFPELLFSRLFSLLFCLLSQLSFICCLFYSLLSVSSLFSFGSSSPPKSLKSKESVPRLV